MKSKKVFIPVVLLVVLVVALGVFWVRRKSKEREVLVSQEVIQHEPGSKKVISEGLVTGELKETGRDFQLKLVAEVRAEPQTVYSTLVDFDQLKDLIPDCTKLEVVKTEGNRIVVYMKRFILFMGKEMGGTLEYTLYPEQLKFEMAVRRDPNANLHETWSIEPSGGKTRVTYLADVKPKRKVPIFMAQAWVKDNFVDLMKAVKDKLEEQPA